ncbi:MAG: hypothetical protein H6918_07990 [Sphingomonadaceae bacterium]|nr:hypothetical protein [Sphingomonadaceae bacterium]
MRAGAVAIGLIVSAAGALLASAVGNAQNDGSGPLLSVSGVASPEEGARLVAWIGDTRNVLASTEFRENLLGLASRYPKVFANPDRPSISVEELQAILDSKDGYRYVPVPIGLFASESYSDSIAYAARTGPIDWQGTGPEAAMSIGRVNMYRYKQSDVVDRSCAINTLAHEISHTISSDAALYRFAITDTALASRPDKETPLASYLVGSVAQCTYLQRAGRIAKAGVAACVEVFGVRAFNNARCPQFANGELVAWRPGLADPAPEL